MISLVYEYSFVGICDMHVSNLRRKLGQAMDGTERIETIRGIGYQYRFGEEA